MGVDVGHFDPSHTLLGWEISIFLVSKLNFREVIDFPIKGHLAIKWGCWNSPPGLSFHYSALSLRNRVPNGQLCVALETLSVHISFSWAGGRDLDSDWLWS